MGHTPDDRLLVPPSTSCDSDWISAPPGVEYEGDIRIFFFNKRVPIPSITITATSTTKTAAVTPTIIAKVAPVDRAGDDAVAPGVESLGVTIAVDGLVLVLGCVVYTSQSGGSILHVQVPLNRLQDSTLVLHSQSWIQSGPYVPSSHSAI